MVKDVAHKSLSIAIVDDHAVFRKILSRRLQRILPGCTIVESENGLVFLEGLEDHHYDLVIMDVKMPVLNGIETTLRAVSKKPTLKVIALSMHDDPQFLRAMKNAGASGYLVKGRDIQNIKTAIIRVLNGQQHFSAN